MDDLCQEFSLHYSIECGAEYDDMMMFELSNHHMASNGDWIVSSTMKHLELIIHGHRRYWIRDPCSQEVER